MEDSAPLWTLNIEKGIEFLSHTVELVCRRRSVLEFDVCVVLCILEDNIRHYC